MIGVMLGATSKDIKDAQSKLLPTIVPMLLFSGYVIPYADIPVFFRWIYYVSIFQWAFTILRINQFHDLDFADGGTGDMYLDMVDCSAADHPLAPMFGILAAYAVGTILVSYAVVRIQAVRKTG